MVLITPTFPLSAPPIILNIKACQKFCANPNPKQEIAVPLRPINRTLFLPDRSENRPHNIAVVNWAKANEPAIIPAWDAMVESGSEGSKDFNW